MIKLLLITLLICSHPPSRLMLSSQTFGSAFASYLLLRITLFRCLFCRLYGYLLVSLIFLHSNLYISRLSWYPIHSSATLIKALKMGRQKMRLTEWTGWTRLLELLHPSLAIKFLIRLVFFFPHLMGPEQVSLGFSPSMFSGGVQEVNR
jgi:hypothetical protein